MCRRSPKRPAQSSVAQLVCRLDDWRPVYRYHLIACSHRRHGQDKTVLSCLCRWCEHNWRQDKLVLSCLDPVFNLQLFSLKYVEDYTENLEIGNWVGTKQICLVLSQICSHRRHGQVKTVLSRLNPVSIFLSNCLVSNFLSCLQQDKTVLSCLQLLCSHRRHGREKTVLSCPCRRYEQAIRVYNA